MAMTARQKRSTGRLEVDLDFIRRRMVRHSFERGSHSFVVVRGSKQGRILGRGEI